MSAKLKNLETKLNKLKAQRKAIEDDILSLEREILKEIGGIGVVLDKLNIINDNTKKKPEKLEKQPINSTEKDKTNEEMILYNAQN